MKLVIEVPDEFTFKLAESDSPRQLAGEPQFSSLKGSQAVSLLTLTNNTGAVIRYALMMNPYTGVLKLIPVLPKAAQFDSLSQAEVLGHVASRKDYRRDPSKEAD